MVLTDTGVLKLIDFGTFLPVPLPYHVKPCVNGYVLYIYHHYLFTIIFTSTGTAKDLNETDLNGSEFVGTPEYMSPEAVRSRPAYMESDLWSLGCCIYQFLVGVTPFKAPSTYLILLKSQVCCLPPLSLLNCWRIYVLFSTRYITSFLRAHICNPNPSPSCPFVFSESEPQVARCPLTRGP